MARKLSPRTRLHRLLGQAEVPVYIVDAERTVAFCNAACRAWTGVAEADLLGRRCDYHSLPRTAPSDEVAAALCPPPEAFQGYRLAQPIRMPQETDGTPRTAHFLPLGEPGEGACGVLVWVTAADAETVASTAREGPNWEPAELHRHLADIRRRERQHYAVAHLIGESPAMNRVRQQVQLAGRAADRVLIRGPEGSGREHVARTIHQARSAADEPLIPLDCRLLDAELLEATIAACVGRMAQSAAEGRGVLLLLDVDHLSPQAQAHLFGSLAIAELQLRTLSTSALPLDDLVRQGRFRGDLACSLTTLTIELPALADRREDVPLLAQWFLEAENAQGGTQYTGFTADAMELLVAYDWPGQVDELAGAVRVACRNASRPTIRVDDLPKLLPLAERAAARQPRSIETIELDVFLEQVESELIRRALRQAKGNKTRAAELLGINRARLHRRLGQLGLDERGPADE